MPNWCSNTLEVRGDSKQVEDFVKKSSNESGEFTMAGLIPCPPELLEITSPVMWRGDETDLEGKKKHDEYIAELMGKYGHSDWYNWCVENWGTKWDVNSQNIHFCDEDMFIVSYDTAWSPNINFVEQVSRMFPDLEFRLTFMEPGCNFCGVAYCSNGEVEVMEGDILLEDGGGREVYYDSDLEKYKYSDTDEVIEDEDFYPEYVNQYDY